MFQLFIRDSREAFQALKSSKYKIILLKVIFCFDNSFALWKINKNKKLEDCFSNNEVKHLYGTK